MSKKEDNKYNSIAVAQAVFVFFILFGLLIGLVFYYDFSGINLGALAFLIAVTCAVLLAKNIYDLAREEEKTVKIAKRLSEDVVSNPSQKLFAEVFNNSPIAYLILDSEGNIITSNKSAVRLLGRSAMRLDKTQFFTCIGAHSEHLILIKEKFRNGVIVSEEEIEINRDGSSGWATMSIFPFTDYANQRMSLVTLLDITRQKEIDTAKSEFVSLASHQLRTPIAGMRWSAELLLMDGAESLSKQQRRYADRLLSNVQRMANLVDDFLQVSRFDLGTRILQPEVVDIQKLINDVVGEQSLMTSSKQIVVERHFDDSVSEIVTDEKLLRMIVTNLYNNAIKYSHNGGVVEITYFREGEDLVIEIKDYGMGIPVEDQSRIFTKVFRASNALREVPDGTGLGLYIVKKAAQTLRGRVTFNSSENVGTTFTVVIPLTLSV
ncbi:MAG: PAS domain S-box protein [Candidatus Pacebacteria bacterium]|nr:PAS domain S-box protein [Candidatus Paceibacterota bacterium]